MIKYLEAKWNEKKLENSSQMDQSRCSLPSDRPQRRKDSVFSKVSSHRSGVKDLSQPIDTYRDQQQFDVDSISKGFLDTSEKKKLTHTDVDPVSDLQHPEHLDQPNQHLYPDSPYAGTEPKPESQAISEECGSIADADDIILEIEENKVEEEQ